MYIIHYTFEYIHVNSTKLRKGGFYQTSNKLDHLTYTYTNLTQPNLT